MRDKRFIKATDDKKTDINMVKWLAESKSGHKACHLKPIFVLRCITFNIHLKLCNFAHVLIGGEPIPEIWEVGTIRPE